MGKLHYSQPESCQRGGVYYLKKSGTGGNVEFDEVRFLSYRPHPAEALVHDGRRPRVVHRRFLFCKASGNGRAS